MISDVVSAPPVAARSVAALPISTEDIALAETREKQLCAAFLGQYCVHARDTLCPDSLSQAQGTPPDSPGGSWHIDRGYGQERWTGDEHEVPKHTR